MSKSTVRELQSILDSLSDDLFDAESELQSVQQRVDTLRAHLAAIAKSIDIVEAQPAVDSEEQPYKVIRNAAVEVLRAEGHPMHYRQLHDELIRRGIDIPGKDSFRNFAAHLSNDARFVRVDTGIWGLQSQIASAADHELRRPPGPGVVLSRPTLLPDRPGPPDSSDRFRMAAVGSSGSVNFIGEELPTDLSAGGDIDDIPF